MTDIILPFVNNGFLANALVAGVLVAIACAIVGTFMVLRGLAFIGDALAHGMLPGVVVALLLGLPGLVGAAAGSLVMIGGISLVMKKTAFSADTAIGLLFVGMLATGVIIVSRSHGFSGELIKVLFGEILGVSTVDLVIQAGATLVLAALAFVFRRPFLLLCFSAEQADVAGFSSRFYHGLMLAMIALTVIVSFQTVGTLLVFGMLMAPAATAALFARRLVSMMVLAGIFGIVAVYLGLLASYHLNVAAGAAIIGCAVSLFFGSLIVTSLWRGRTKPRTRVH